MAPWFLGRAGSAQGNTRSAACRAVATVPQGVLHGTGATDGEDRIVAYRRLPSYPLVVAVGSRTRLSMATWRDDAILHGGLGVSLAAVLALLALLS